MTRFSALLLISISALICWSTCLTAGLTVEEQLKQLQNNLMEVKDILAAKARRLEALEHENLMNLEMSKAQAAQMKKLALKIEVQESLLNALHLRGISLGSRTGARLDEDEKPREEYAANEVSLRQGMSSLPRSCQDLKNNGHTSSGIYSVVGPKFMENVFCNFCKTTNDPSFQTFIGYVDVKSSPVYFFVYRYWDWNQIHTPITFNAEILNIGRAMNSQTGKFVAPRAGKYFFSASGVVRFPASSDKSTFTLDLFWNNRQFATGVADESNSAGGQSETFSMKTTLDLAAGDDIILMILPQGMSPGVYIEGGTKFHFTGYMLEEEISQSPNVKLLSMAI